MPLASLSCTLVTLLLGPGDDWPRYGGPTGVGVSHEAHWVAKGRAEPLWKKNVGLGYSSFAVAGQHVFTLGHDRAGGEDVLWALDADTGDERWTATWKSALWDKYHGGGTLTTPTYHAGKVFVAEREGLVLCVRAATGEQVWSKNLAHELDVEPPTWGFAGSPVLVGDDLVVHMGRVVGLDPATGEVRWKGAVDGGASYSTPIAITRGEKPALAVFGGNGLALFEPGSGARMGFLPWETRYEVNAMTPVPLDGRLFISSGYGHGCALVDVSGETPRVVWESKVMRNQMSGAVPWDGHLYGFDDKVLKCIDLAGEERWNQRGLGQGALTVADGRLIVVSEGGELIVARATPERFEELSRVKALEGAVCWTQPVLANGRIFVRNQAGDVVVLDHRQ
jgi:outer membrane protein assembly factor BamB